VFTEVKDLGQKTISSTWVVTEKHNSDNVAVKACLVALGFEEELSSNVDSLTASKSTPRIFMSVAASKRWRCQTIDIKSAFLQGKTIDRDVYLQPPRDIKKDGTIWKLNKVVYGLNDAARNWYQSVIEFLIKLWYQSVIEFLIKLLLYSI